jgi:uncharacterized membrane protein
VNGWVALVLVLNVLFLAFIVWQMFADWMYFRRYDRQERMSDEWLQRRAREEHR